MPQTTAEVVPSGPYFAFTLSELNDELTRYKAARVQSGSPLLNASVNGQSYGFGPRRDWTIDEWQVQLQAAFYFLNPGLFPMAAPTNAAVAAFF